MHFGVLMTQGEAAMVPEDVGQKAAHMLLEEIDRGGVTDGTHQVYQRPPLIWLGLVKLQPCQHACVNAHKSVGCKGATEA